MVRGWWGYRYRGSGVEARQHREGTLSIDVCDATTNRPVWHGWAKKELEDVKQSEMAIRVAVDAVLAAIPPHGAGAGLLPTGFRD